MRKGGGSVISLFDNASYLVLIMAHASTLKPTLTPLLLWGLGVGYVVSGMYFGWNLGLEQGGTLGLGTATMAAILMYTAFSFSYSELACAIPRAGGALDYASRAFGSEVGFITGLAQVIEFVFAPPAIAIAIGTYGHSAYAPIDIHIAAVSVYVLFTAVNIFGVRAAATFELIITVLAVGELIIFAGVTLPHFSMAQFTHDPLPHGWAGAFAALPFAIWFFLGIEGVANVAEETLHPQRDITRGFGWAILTLVLLCVLTFLACVGVAGWNAVVYNPDHSTSDAPLLLAMGQVIPATHWLYRLLISIGLFGLIASFHGLILASGRATFEMGRVGYMPRWLGHVHSRYATPATALIANALVGIIAIYTGHTAAIITLSVFGALTLYILAMCALIRLRNIEPQMERPFRVPLYPFTPILALVIASLSMLAMIWYNGTLAAIYFGIVLVGYVLYRSLVKQKRPKTSILQDNE